MGSAPGLFGKVFCLACLLLCPLSSAGEHAPVLPPPGKTWLFIGQDLDSVAGYRSKVCASENETTYGDLLEGNMPVTLARDVNHGAGRLNAATSAARSKRLAVGIYMVDATPAVAAGKCDRQIDAYARMMVSHPATFFLLRIGYEFDGPWNRYPAMDYVKAFRHVAGRLRGAKATNFATVWQSCADGSVVKDSALSDYYPGDGVVDWVGLSYFRSDHGPARQTVLAFARAHGKPVMICEAAPQGYQVDELSRAAVMGPPLSKAMVTAEALWKDWYGPFFEFIHRHRDQVRAVAYINADWDSQAMWGPGSGYRQGYWGDSRVEGNDEIRARWLEETAGPSWVR